MTRHTSVSVSLREIIVLAICAALVAGAFLYSGQSREPLSSSETRFVEKSLGGLQIVPASCPSDPHYSGECSGEPPTPSPGHCAISAEPWNISVGGSSTLTWNVADQGSAFKVSTPTNITLSGVGSVASSGSHNTGPLQQTTSYTLSGIYSFAGVQVGSFSCSRTVVVGDIQCIPHYTCAGSGLGGLRNSCTGVIEYCPAGMKCWDNQCQCIPGTTCATTCPAGQSWMNGSCQPPGTCSAQYFCKDNDLWINNKNNQCVEAQLEQECSYGCSAGRCIGAPPGLGNITASPALIHSGETSQISWTTQNARVGSCTVTENNPDIEDAWTGTSGTQPSSAISQQTAYTLACLGLDNQPFSDKVIVNIIPEWEEQ